MLLNGKSERNFGRAVRFYRRWMSLSCSAERLSRTREPIEMSFDFSLMSYVARTYPADRPLSEIVEPVFWERMPLHSQLLGLCARRDRASWIRKGKPVGTAKDLALPSF